MLRRVEMQRIQNGPGAMIMKTTQGRISKDIYGYLRIYMAI